MPAIRHTGPGYRGSQDGQFCIVSSGEVLSLSPAACARLLEDFPLEWELVETACAEEQSPAYMKPEGVSRKKPTKPRHTR